MKAVCLLSGGIDSLTVMAQAIENGYEVIPVTMKYGQLHECEVLSAQKIAQFYKAYWWLVAMPDIFHGTSALTGDAPMPSLSYEELAKKAGPSPTVVPFRNANFISAATTIAINSKAVAVYIGVHAEDASHWAYPDCSPEFIGAMMNAVWVGSYGEVRLVAPFQYMKKVDVLHRGLMLNAPVRLTWSCYNPSVDPQGASAIYTACGKCPTCVSRIAAFKEYGTQDPMDYDIDIDWGRCIPLVMVE